MILSEVSDQICSDVFFLAEAVKVSVLFVLIPAGRQ